jgi:hypothetical protein
LSLDPTSAVNGKRSRIMVGRQGRQAARKAPVSVTPTVTLPRKGVTPDAKLAALIPTIHRTPDGTYGVPKINAELHDDGELDQSQACRPPHERSRTRRIAAA